MFKTAHRCLRHLSNSEVSGTLNKGTSLNETGQSQGLSPVERHVTF